MKLDTHKVIYLKAIPTKFESIHKANGDPEFKLTDNTKTYHFKCHNDIERMKWMRGINYYRRKREITAYINKLNHKEKIELLLDHIYDKKIPRHQQFITATYDKNDYDPNKKSFKKTAKKFEVSIPQKFGKNKPRIIEFDLKSNPKQLKIYKTNEYTAYIVLARAALLDFKFDLKKLIVSLFISRDKGKNRKDFQFDTAKDLERFRSILNYGFRRDNYGFIYVHQQLINNFKRLTEAEIDVAQRRSRSKTILDQIPLQQYDSYHEMKQMDVIQKIQQLESIQQQPHDNEDDQRNEQLQDDILQQISSSDDEDSDHPNTSAKLLDNL